MIDLNKLAKEIHQQQKDKGHWDNPRQIGTLLMLITSELSEALEADRKGKYAKINDPEFVINGKTIKEDLDLAYEEGDMIKFADIFRTQVKDTLENEIADAFIRLLDFVGHENIDIEKHIQYKLFYNKTREYKHGKAY